MICVDEMGPELAKSFADQRLVDATKRPVVRATQEIDYGRRSKDYIFGAFQPATGDAVTVDCPGRTIANWIDFPEKVDQHIAPEIERVYAILDNLNTNHADDVLLFCIRHPRWESVFQPTYAAYLNLIEPWWRVLCLLVLKRRRFETWEALTAAVREATADWNAHKHPFVWGRRRRHWPARKAGIGLVPSGT